uniref:CSN8/PSMD8/EIF3K domain-containing protein n=1 Tax=Romanomermis culicivorax TaxID=13658 RepID=A0A915IRG0_ROMCU
MELDEIDAAAVPAVEVELTMSNLEHEELVNGHLSAKKCGQLLLFYLIENDLLNARFLWRRTPLDVKQQKDMSADLSAIWKVVLLLLKKDYVNFYSILKKEWSAEIKTYRRTCASKMVIDLENAALVIGIGEFIQYLSQPIIFLKRPNPLYTSMNQYTYQMIHFFDYIRPGSSNFASSDPDP